MLSDFDESVAAIAFRLGVSHQVCNLPLNPFTTCCPEGSGNWYPTGLLNQCPPGHGRSNRLPSASGRRVRLRAALLRVRILPRTPQARCPTRQRQQAQTVSRIGSNPTEPTNAAVVQRQLGGRTTFYAPVADGEASGFQTRLWVFESPLGCHAPQQQMASGRAATPACAVRIRGGAPISPSAEEWTSC